VFGFVNVYKSELKIKDYEIFRAYYCGLCKALGKRYNQLVRFGLSYDMTFLAIIADSLNDDAPCISKQGCLKHLGQHMVCERNNAIDYSSDVSIILAYHKLCDDVSDEHSAKAFFARLPYIKAYKTACRKLPDLSRCVKEQLFRLSKIEADKCASIDIAADPFALITSSVFKSFDPSLEAIGYNIGRFIYIADAYSDLTHDLKTNNYNPYIYAHDEQHLKSQSFKQEVMGSLNMTLAAVANSYKDLKIKKNKDILDNIIYMGLRYACDNLFGINGGKK